MKKIEKIKSFLQFLVPRHLGGRFFNTLAKKRPQVPNWEELPKLMSIRSTADLLDVHPNTLRKWDQQGRLPAIRLGTRQDRRYERHRVQELWHAAQLSPASTLISGVGRWQRNWLFFRHRWLRPLAVSVSIAIAIGIISQMNLVVASQPVPSTATFTPQVCSGWQNAKRAEKMDLADGAPGSDFNSRNSVYYDVNQYRVHSRENENISVGNLDSPAALFSCTGFSSDRFPSNGTITHAQLVFSLFSRAVGTEPDGFIVETSIDGDHWTVRGVAPVRTEKPGRQTFDLGSDIDRSTLAQLRVRITPDVDIATPAVTTWLDGIAVQTDIVTPVAVDKKKNSAAEQDLNKLIAFSQATYASTETPVITVPKRESKKLLFVTTKKVDWTLNSVTLVDSQQQVTTPQYTTTDEPDGSDISTSVNFQTIGLHPGKYRVQVSMRNTEGGEATIEKEFLWGVVALNFDRPNPRPGQAVIGEIGVLNDAGTTLCDAKIEVKLTTPHGQTTTFNEKRNNLKHSGICVDKGVTNQADYSFRFTPEQNGTYHLSLVATTSVGERRVEENLLVDEKSPFDVQRSDFSTRIYPPAPYNETISITPANDYRGIVTERVPADFAISNLVPEGIIVPGEKPGDAQLIQWPVDWIGGKNYFLRYTYKAPYISPATFLLGPMMIEANTLSGADWIESRQWQIASDSVLDVGAVDFAPAQADVIEPLRAAYRNDETVDVKVFKSGYKFKPGKVKRGLGADKASTVTSVDIVGPAGTTEPVTMTSSDVTQSGRGLELLHLTHGRSFRPGLYTLRLTVTDGTVTSVEDRTFAWGVLAVNLRRSIERPNTPTHIGVAVLDNFGRTICDAIATLDVTDPTGKVTTLKTADDTIAKNPNCVDKGVTNDFDYSAAYTTGIAGSYKLRLTADQGDGLKSIDDTFEVRDSVDFDIERTDFSMRIYPIANYDQKFTITANKDYQGAIHETVPASFIISNISDGGAVLPIVDGQDISWTVDWKAGETHTLSYTIDFPDVSPEFYLLGPLTIGTFQEARQWQVASDANCNATGSGSWGDIDTANFLNCTGRASSGSGTGNRPDPADNLTINSGVVVDFLEGTATINSLIINNSGATTGLNWPGADTLTVTTTTSCSAPSSNATTTIAIGGGFLETAGITLNGGSASKICALTLSTGTITTTAGLTFAGTLGNARLTTTGAATIINTGAITAAGTLSLTAGTLVKFHGSSSVTAAFTTWKNWEVVDGTTTLSASATQTLAGLQIDSGAELANGANLITMKCTGTGVNGFRIDGTLSGTGGVTWATATGCVVEGAGAVTATGTMTVNIAISIASTANISFGAAGATAIFTVATGVIVTNNGTVSLLNGTTTGGLAGLGTWTNAANSTLNTAGVGTNAIAITTLTASASPNTVNYAGAAQTCIGSGGTQTYITLKFSGSGAKTCAITTPTVTNAEVSGTATWTHTAALTLSGTLTISGGTLTTGAVAFAVTGATSITSGTLSLTSSTGNKTLTGLVTLNGTGTLSGAASTIIVGTGITNTAGTVSITGTVTMSTLNGALTSTTAMSITTLTMNTAAAFTHAGAGGLTVATFTATSLAVVTNTGLVEVTTSLTGTGNFTNGNGGTLNINFTGTPGITTLSASTTSNLVNYKFAGTQTCNVAQYYNLTFSGSGAKTCAPTSPTLNNVQTSGTATWTTSNTQTITGTLTIDSGTAVHLDNFAFTVSSTTSVTGTLDTVTAAHSTTKTFTGNVTINSGGTWDLTTGNPATSFAGDLTASTGTVTFNNGTGGATWTASKQLAGTVNMTFGGTVTINTAFTLTNNNTGTVQFATINGAAASSSLATGLNSTTKVTAAPMATGTIVPSTSANTFDYNYATATVVAPTTNPYYHLTLSGSGTAVMPGTGLTSLNGNFTLSGTVTTSTASTLTVSGSVSVGTGTTLNINHDVTITGTITNTTTGVINNTSGTPTVTINGTASMCGGNSGNCTFYNLTFGGASTTFGSNFTVNNNLTLPASVTAGSTTVTMVGTSGAIVGGGSTIFNLTVNGTNSTTTLNTSDLTVSGTLTIGGDAEVNTDVLSIAVNRTISATGTTTLTDSTDTISGAGTLRFTDTSSGPGTTGTLSSVVRYDATTLDIANTTFDARTYAGKVELFSSKATAANVSCADASTYTTTGATSHLHLLANGAGNLNLLCDTATDPTITIGGDLDFTGTDVTGAEAITSGAAIWSVAGNVDFTDGTYTATTSNTLTLNGTTSMTLNSACANTDTCTNAYLYNLTINKTDAADANDNVTLTTTGIRVANLLTITDGELVQGALNVRAEGASAVSIAAAGKWSNISTGDLKLGGTFVNAGTAIFNSNNGSQCVDGADDIVITSTVGATQRLWTNTGTLTLYNVNATDMTNSSITAYTSTLSNTTWAVGSCGIIVSGSCAAFNESTACVDETSVGDEIRVAVNGTLDANDKDTVVDAAWSFTLNPSPTIGQILTFFVNGAAAADRAVAVTKYDGTGNITGVVLYKEHLTIGSDDNQTLTNTNLGQYDNSVSADADVFHDVNVTDDLTVDATAFSTQEELWIGDGDIFQPASAGGADVTSTHVEIADTATAGVGTWTANSNVINVAGNWVVSGSGVFTAGTSTLTFNSTSAAQDFTTGAEIYNAITINNTGTSGATDDINVSGNLDVDGTLTITDGDLDLAASDPNVTTAGAVAIGASGLVTKADNGTATWIFDGTGTSTWTDSATTTQDVGLVTIDGTTKTVNMGSSVRATKLTVTDTFGLASSGYTLTLTGSGQGAAQPLTVTGTLNEGTNSTVDFIGSATSDIERESYWNLSVRPGGAVTHHAEGVGTLTVLGNLSVGDGSAAGIFNLDTNDPTVDVDGNVTINASGTLVASLTGALTVGGSWLNNGAFTHSSGTVTFDAGAVGKTLVGTMTGASAFYNLIFSNAAGGWANSSSALAVANDLTMTAGELSGTSDVTVNGHAVGTAGVINKSGGVFNQRITATPKTFGPSTASTSWTFYDLTFSNGNGGATPVAINATSCSTCGVTVTDIWLIGGASDAAGATTTLDASDKTWTLSGNIAQPFQTRTTNPIAVFTASGSTVEYSGAYGSGNLKYQVATYYSLTFSRVQASGIEIYNPSAAALETYVNNTLTVNSGAVISMTDANDHLISGYGGTCSIAGSGTIRGAGKYYYYCSADFPTAIVMGDGTEALDYFYINPYNATGGTITVAGVNSGTRTFTANLIPYSDNAGTRTVNFGSGASQTFVMNQLSVCIYGGTFTIDATANNPNFTIVTNLGFSQSCASASSIAFNAGNGTYNVGGNVDFSNKGTFNPGSGTVNLNGSAAQTVTVDSGDTFNNLTLNNTGADGATDNVTISGNLVVSSDLSVTNGDLVLSSGNPNLNVAGNVTIGSSAFVSKGTGTWTFDGTAAKTFTDSSSGGPQDIGVVSINKTDTGAPATNDKVTLASSMTASKVTIDGTGGQADTLNLASSGYTLKLNGDGASATVLTVTGTLTPGTSSTVQFNAVNSGGTVVVPATTYNSIKLSGNETYDLGNNLTSGNALTGGVTIDAGGATLDAVLGSNYSMALAGDWTNNGSFTARTGTVTMTGTVNLTGSTATTFNNLTITGTTVTVPAGGSDVTVSGTLNVNDSKTLSIATGRTVTNSGVLNINSTGTISGAGTITFTNTTTGIPAGTTGTLSSIVRFDATTADVPTGAIIARTYSGDLEFYTNRSATSNAWTPAAGTYNVTGNFKIITGATVALVPTFLATTATVTMNITGNLTYTKGGSAIPAITSGAGTWTANNNVDFTNGTFTSTAGNTVTMNASTDGTGTLTQNGNTISNLTTLGTGTITLTNETHTINNNLNLGSTATISAGTSTVTLGTGGGTIDGGGQTLTTLNINRNYTLQNSDLTVVGQLSVANFRTLTINSGITLTNTFGTDISSTGSIAGAGTLRFTSASGGPGTTLTTVSSIVRYDATGGDIPAATFDARTYAGRVELYSTHTALRTVNCADNISYTLSGASSHLWLQADGTGNLALACDTTTDPGTRFTIGGDLDYVGTNATGIESITAGPSIWSVAGNVNLQDNQGSPQAGVFSIPTTHTLTMTGASKTLTAAGNSLYNLTTSSTDAVSGATTVSNDVTISGGTLTAPSAATLTVGHDFINNAAFTHNSGTVLMSSTGGNINGSADSTFNNLTISSAGNAVITVGGSEDPTVAGVLTVASSDTLTIGSGRLVTNTSVTDANNDGTINGAGTLVFTNTSGGPDSNANSTGSYTSIVRFDGTSGDILSTTFDARTYGGVVELYSNSTSNRTITFIGSTYTFSSDVTPWANNNGDVFVDGGTNNPTINITGNLDFSNSSGNGTEVLAMGDGTWTVTGNVDFTGGVAGPQIANLSPIWDESAHRNTTDLNGCPGTVIVDTCEGTTTNKIGQLWNNGTCDVNLEDEIHDYYRTGIEYNPTGINDSATITQVQLNSYVSVAVTSSNVSFGRSSVDDLQDDSGGITCTSATTPKFNYLGDAEFTSYVANSTAFGSTGIKIVDLGTTAMADVSSRKTGTTARLTLAIKSISNMSSPGEINSDSASANTPILRVAYVVNSTGTLVMNGTGKNLTSAGNHLYNLTIPGTVTLADNTTIDGNFDLTSGDVTPGSTTVTMAGVSKTLTAPAAGDSLANLTIDPATAGTVTLAAGGGNLTVSSLLTTATGDTLSIGSSRTLTLSGASGTTLTNNGTISGAGTLTYKNNVTAFPSAGTISSILRMDATGGDQTIAGINVATRTFGGVVEIYNNDSVAAHTVSFVTGSSRTYTFASHLYLIAANTKNITLNADLATDPTVNVTGDLDFTGTDPTGNEILISGGNTWKISGHVTLSDGTYTATSNNTLKMDGTKDLIGAGNTLYNLLVDGVNTTVTVTTSDIIVSNSILIGGSLDGDNDTLSIAVNRLVTMTSGSNVTLIGSGTDKITGAGTLVITSSHATPINSNGTIDVSTVRFDVSTNTVNMPNRAWGGTLNIQAYNTSSTLRAVVMASGTHTIPGNVTVDTTGTGGATLDGATNSASTAITGNITMSKSSTGVPLITTGTSANTWTVSGNVDFSNGTFTGGSGNTLTMNGNGTLTSNGQTLNNFSTTGSVTPILANVTHTIAGNVTIGSTGLTAGTSTVVMTGTKNLVGGGKTLNNLTINGVNTTVSAITSDLTVSGDLVIGGSSDGDNDTLDIAGGRLITLSSNTGTPLTFNDTAGGTNSITGAGTLAYQNPTTTLTTAGTITSILRFDTANGNLVVPVRTYGAQVEAYNNTSTNRTVTLGTAGLQSISFPSHFYLIANSTADIFVDGGTYNPTVNVTGILDFTGTGTGTEVLAMGDGTWTASDNADFTGGIVGPQVANISPAWDDSIRWRANYAATTCLSNDGEDTFACTGTSANNFGYNPSTPSCDEGSAQTIDNYRLGMEFDTTGINDLATVTGVYLDTTITAAVANVSIGLSSAPGALSAADCSTAASTYTLLGGTQYLPGTTVYNTTGAKTINLGATAVADVQSRIDGTPAGFAVNINDGGTLGTLDSDTGTNPPILRVTYIVNLTGTLIMNGVGKSLTSGGNTLNNVTFSAGSGTNTLGDAATLSGDLVVSTGTTLSGAANNMTINGGDVTGDGTITFSGGTFLVDGTGNFGGATGWTFSSLTFGSSGTTTSATGSGGVSVASVLTISGTHVLDAGSKTWTLSGTATPITRAGTFTASTSTVTYTSGSGVTALSSAAMTTTNAFYNLTVNGTGTFNATSAATANNEVRVTSGTLAMGANALISGSTSVANSGSIYVAASQSLTQTAGSTTTILGSAAGANCIGSNGASCTGTAGTITLGNLTIGDSSTTFTNTFGGTNPVMTVANVLTVTLNATLNGGSGTITLSGSGTPFVNSQTFTYATSTIKYTGDGATNVLGMSGSGGSNGYYNLTLSPAVSANRVYTLGTTIQVNNNLAITPSNAANSLTTNIGSGGLTVVGSTTIQPTGSATANLTTQAGLNYAFTTGSLSVQSAGTFTGNATATVTVSGVVTIASGGVLSSTSGNLAVSGNYSNSGTFTDNSGTVTLNGSSQQSMNGTMTGASDFNNLTVTNSSGSDPDSSPSVILAAAATTAGTFTAATNNSKIRFNAGSTYTLNAINFTGTAGNMVYLRSSSAGSYFTINAGVGARTVTFTRVKDSDACGSTGGEIDASDGTNEDDGNTKCWFIKKLTVSLSANTANLGTLSTSNVSQAGITSTVTANSATGYVSLVKYDQTLTAGAFSIPNSAGGTIVAGAASEYGAASSQTGNTVAQWSPAACTTTGTTSNATALSTSFQSFASKATPATAEVTTLCLLATITGLQQPGAYTSTLTIVTTAKF